MSEGIIVALINTLGGIVGAIVGALIGAYATIKAAEKREQQTPTNAPLQISQFKWSSPKNVLILLATAVIGSLVGVILTILLFQQNNVLPSTELDRLTLRPACGENYTIDANMPVEIQYGTFWVRGQELAQDIASHLTVSLIKDGISVNGIEQSVVPTKELPGAYCGSIDLDEGYGVYYTAQIDSFEPGIYSIKVIYTFDQQVTDGYDGDNDGELDLYGPGDTTFEFTIEAKP